MAGKTLSNAAARTLMMKSAMRKSQPITPNQSYSPGGIQTFQLPKAGLAQAIIVDYQIPVTITLNGGTVAQSPKGPHNLWQLVTVQDYNGITRVLSSGFMLYNLSVFKKRNWEPSSEYPYQMPAAQLPYSAQSSYFTARRWNYPTATGTIVGTLIIPLAFDWNDVRGALPLNVPNGQVTLQLQANPNLGLVGSIEAPYVLTGSATVVAGANPTVTATVYYLDPIALDPRLVPPGEYTGSIPVPYDDISLVHEVKSFTDSANMSPSQEKLYSLQSGRDYLRVIASVNENATFNTNHLTRVRWVYDGNTPVKDEFTNAHLAWWQYHLGRDLMDGVVGYDFTDRSWDGNSYGSLGFGITFASGFVTSGNPYVEYLTDCLYYASMANA